ncbi:MAG: hypothetical protein CL662_13620 [Bacteroidetes bacterium]|nr:hypothetical protein [Bacteroidota bacterium]|tara:strand:- start:946 stop:1425 length:480 start_codon:yes stop_codon:yes gene_type:complete
MKYKSLFLFVLFLGLSVNANAQNDELSSVLKAFKITLGADGNEVATEVTEVKPGDIIEYRLTYQNETDGSLTQITPVLPIPLEMFYLDNSASPELSGASVSPTANDFRQPPLTRQVTLPDGSQVNRVIPAQEYRRIQWLVPALAAGESITLTARVEVRS